MAMLTHQLDITFGSRYGRYASVHSQLSLLDLVTYSEERIAFSHAGRPVISAHKFEEVLDGRHSVVENGVRVWDLHVVLYLDMPHRSTNQPRLQAAWERKYVGWYCGHTSSTLCALDIRLSLGFRYRVTGSIHSRSSHVLCSLWKGRPNKSCCSKSRAEADEHTRRTCLFVSVCGQEVFDNSDCRFFASFWIRH